MSLAQRNQKAYNNGLRGEQYALSLFRDHIELIDRLIDAKIDGKLVEIKTCQEYQKHGSKRRRGRFILDKEQHEHLIKNGGYYLFIVLMHDGSVKHKFVKADEIEFKRKLNWIRVFGSDRDGQER